jgi:hypothetical protein
MNYTPHMRKLLLLLLMALLDNLPVRSQSLSPVVVSTSGAFYSNSTAMLSSTIGELTMVQTFISGNSILTQGFQQDFDFNVGYPAIRSFSSTDVYPNPTTGHLFIRIGSNYIGDVDAEVFDVQGRLVFRKTYTSDVNGTPLSLEIGGMVTGIYFVKVITGKEQYTAKINLTSI